LKRREAGDWVGFGDFYFVNPGGSRTFAKTMMQAGKLLAFTLGEDFDGGVGIVANPAGDLKDVGFAFDKPAEADALDAAAHDETVGGAGWIGRWIVGG